MTQKELNELGRKNTIASERMKKVLEQWEKCPECKGLGYHPVGGPSCICPLCKGKKYLGFKP